MRGFWLLKAQKTNSIVTNVTQLAQRVNYITAALNAFSLKTEIKTAEPFSFQL